MANRARPCVLSARWRDTAITATTKRPIQKRFVHCGMPGRPWAAPTASTLMMTTRMISPNPRVTMAR
jgi:hypothetical protein